MLHTNLLVFQVNDSKIHEMQQTLRSYIFQGTYSQYRTVMHLGLHGPGMQQLVVLLLHNVLFFSIASIFRRQYFFVLLYIKVTIWPPAIDSFFYHKHFFGWYYCILLSSKMFREHIQLITAVLNNKQFIYLIVPVQAHYIS